MKNKYFLKIITMTIVFIISMPVWSGEAEWQMHMDAAKAASKQRIGSSEQQKNKIRSHLKAALKEAEGFAENDPRLADTLFYLGTVFYYDVFVAEKSEERLNTLKRALTIQENSLGEHIKTANTLSALARISSRLRRWQEAEPLLKRSIKIRENLNDKPENIQHEKRNLAESYYYLDRYEEAKPLYKELLSLKKEKNIPYEVAFATMDLAKNHYAQGNFEEAEIAMKKVITIQERMPFDSAHKLSYLPNSLTKLGKIYRSQKKFKKAEETFKRAINLYLASRDKGFLSMKFPLRQLLDLYSHQGRKQEGQLFRKSIENKGKYKIDDSELLIDPKNFNKL